MTKQIRYYKVLTDNLKSPYQGQQYKLDRWYNEPRVGELGGGGCQRGLYAGPIEGLLDLRGLLCTPKNEIRRRILENSG